MLTGGIFLLSGATQDWINNLFPDIPVRMILALTLIFYALKEPNNFVGVLKEKL